MQNTLLLQDMREQHGGVLLHGTDSTGQVALVQTIEVPGHEPPCHRHAREDTLIYVQAGMLAVYRDNAWLPAPAGAAVWIPRGTDHTFAVVGDVALVLMLFMPAGFEGFYREAGDILPWSHATAPQLDRLVAMAARYGCDITGPHPGRPKPADAP